MIVAIDGPAGAGKSTVARRVAASLGFRYLDTGAMYRALAWLALERGVRLEDGTAVAVLADASPVSFDGDRVRIDGRDVSAEIRSTRIDRVVSSVACHPDVRRIMRERQSELADRGDVVIEGRDIGTAVRPDADVKVYLVADPAVRARRRVAERPDLGVDTIAGDLRVRDERDAAQTRPAADAVTVDTTELTVDDVVARVELLVAARAGA